MDEKTKNGIQVILNGGKREMNSATLPIQWWFSKEVIEKNPQYILIFEQNGEEKKSYSGETTHGRRYVCKVSEAVKFLQIFSAGYHRIIVVALAGERAEETAKRYLERENTDHYQRSLSWHEHDLKDYEYPSFIAASCIEEFEVPEELFAKKPKTKFGKFIWKWINLWFKKDPRDQCHYRKRKILAFTLQPPVMLPWWLIKYGIAGTIGALYIFLASLVILFFGYRPKPIFKGMWKTVIWESDDMDVRRFDEYDADPERNNSIFRLWSRKEIPGKYREYEYKYMPIAPYCVVLVLAALIGIPYLIKNLPANILVLAGIITASIIGIVFFVRFYIKKLAPAIVDKITEQGRQRQITKAQRKKEWLATNFDLSRKTAEIHLDQLPKPPDFSGKIIQKFRVGFWTLKAKVCKPYQK